MIIIQNLVSSINYSNLECIICYLRDGICKTAREYNLFRPNIPSCSVLVISSSFFCFSVSTTSARLPLRRSGVPKLTLLISSQRSRPPSSGLCGEVEVFRKEYKEHNLLLSDSCKETRQ